MSFFGALRRLVLTPSLASVTFEQRGFPGPFTDATLRLEAIPQSVICGFEWAIEARGLWEVERRLDMVDPELQGFAYEGATMAFTVLDAMGPGRGRRTRDLLTGPGEPHIFLAYIGMGLAMARLLHAGDRLANVLEAVRGVDAEFALTVGEEDAAALGPLPGNVRPMGWVPLHRLLPGCAAIIHHGGSGTMLTAGVAGIPQLIVPEGADNDYNGRILAGYGCALTASPGKVRPAMVETLLADEGLRAAARELRAEIEWMPAPAELIDDIVEFVH